jgi:predicted ATP-binding protein involved in virulence
MIDKRKAYEEKLAAQLEEWTAQVALFKAKSEKAAAAAKIEYYEITETLQRKHDEARKKLQELQLSGDDAWETLKTGVENAWTEVKNAFHDAAAKFK